MRKIYLIRHCKPDLPPGPRLCYGVTDVPLGAVGRMQGVLLAEFMKTRPVTQVFCSGLSRSRDTARYLTGSPTEIPGLREMDAGQWEGLDFDTIKARWPGVYEQRGLDPATPIPGGETLADGQRRFLAAMEQAVAQSQGDIAVVGHATSMRTFFCHVLGRPLGRLWDIFPPYGSVTELWWDGEFHIETIGAVPRPELDEALCEKLMTAAGGPWEHCKQVAAEAVRIASALPELNADRLKCAAWLHDLARSQRDHPAVGAAWLRELGYPEVAALVEGHHDPASEEIDEKTVLFLADKVPIEGRFAASLEKCRTQEARAAHKRRLELALTLKYKINARCGKEVIV